MCLLEILIILPRHVGLRWDISISDQACRSPIGLRLISDGSPMVFPWVSDGSPIGLR